jgi:hypothetical protein
VSDPEPTDEHDEGLAAALADATARRAASLAFALGGTLEPDRFVLAAAPVAVVFTRDLDRHAKSTHRSGRLAPELMPFLVDAVERTRERIAWAEGTDSPYLIALVLATFYTVENERTGALGLGVRPDATPAVRILTGDETTRDIAGRPGTTILRVLAPVSGADDRDRQVGVELLWEARPIVG